MTNNTNKYTKLDGIFRTAATDNTVVDCGLIEIKKIRYQVKAIITNNDDKPIFINNDEITTKLSDTAQKVSEAAQAVLGNSTSYISVNLDNLSSDPVNPPKGQIFKENGPDGDFDLTSKAIASLRKVSEDVKNTSTISSIGFINFGANCYINASLQSIFTSEDKNFLRNFLAVDSNVNYENDLALLSSSSIISLPKQIFTDTFTGNITEENEKIYEKRRDSRWELIVLLRNLYVAYKNQNKEDLKAAETKLFNYFDRYWKENGNKSLDTKKHCDAAEFLTYLFDQIDISNNLGVNLNEKRQFINPKNLSDKTTSQTLQKNLIILSSLPPCAYSNKDFPNVAKNITAIYKDNPKNGIIKLKRDDKIYNQESSQEIPTINNLKEIPNTLFIQMKRFGCSNKESLKDRTPINQLDKKIKLMFQTSDGKWYQQTYQPSFYICHRGSPTSGHVTGIKYQENNYTIYNDENVNSSKEMPEYLGEEAYVIRIEKCQEDPKLYKETEQNPLNDPIIIPTDDELNQWIQAQDKE